MIGSLCSVAMNKGMIKGLTEILVTTALVLTDAVDVNLNSAIISVLNAKLLRMFFYRKFEWLICFYEHDLPPDHNRLSMRIRHIDC